MTRPDHHACPGSCKHGSGGGGGSGNGAQPEETALEAKRSMQLHMLINWKKWSAPPLFPPKSIARKHVAGGAESLGQRLVGGTARRIQITSKVQTDALMGCTAEYASYEFA